MTPNAVTVDTVDGGDPTELGSPAACIAKIRLGDRVSDIVTSPNSSVSYAALSNSIAVISSLHDVSCTVPISAHPNCGTVSVIDIADHRVHAIPDACCVQPVVTLDGAFIYAAGSTTDSGGCRGWISVIDPTGATVAAISGPHGYVPTALTAGPNGKRVYLAWSRRSAYWQYDTGLVGVIDTATNATIDTIELGASPDTIAISPDGSTMYTTHYDQRSLSQIDVASARITPIALGDNPLGVSLTPDGLQAYVANCCSLSVIDLSPTKRRELR
jgi:YVTN family beta-propeller protein